MGKESSRQLTVACLKWGTKYSVDYVNILYSMVRRHLSAPHRFVCLTDDPAGIACETLPIVPNLPTWWGKLTLFNHPLPGRILYLDLDTVIVDGIDGFAAYDGPFCLIKPFYRDRGFASGVMSIAPDFGRQVWEKFARNPQAAIESLSPIRRPTLEQRRPAMARNDRSARRLLAGRASGPACLIQGSLCRGPPGGCAPRLLPRQTRSPRGRRSLGERALAARAIVRRKQRPLALDQAALRRAGGSARGRKRGLDHGFANG